MRPFAKEGAFLGQKETKEFDMQTVGQNLKNAHFALGMQARLRFLFGK